MAKRRATDQTPPEPGVESRFVGAGLLGPTPEAWPVVRLSEVTYEGTDRNRELTAGRDDVLGVDNQRGLLPSDRLLGDDFARYKFVRKGEFAYNPMRLNVGSIGLSGFDKPGLVSPDYIVFGCNRDRLDPDFLDLFRLSDGWKNQIRLSGAGSIRIRYYYRDIAKFVVPLPPLPEQRAIAHVLRTVQRAKEAAEAVVAAARQLKRSLLRHLFTYGPVPVEQADRVPLKETEVGPVPATWKITTVGEVITKGPQNGVYKPKTDYGSGSPIVRIDDFENEGSIIESVPNLVRLTDAEVSTYGLVPDDLLVNRVNSLSHLGKTGLVGQLPVSTVFESNMMRFGVNAEQVRPRYLFYFMNLPACRTVMRSKAKRAVAQSSINQEDVKSLPLPMPSTGEQDKLIQMVSAAEAKLAAELSKVTALDALFKTLLRDLMTGRVRVHDLGLPPSAGAKP